MRHRPIATLALLFVAASLFAQAKTSLNIQSNQSGARVYLNDHLAGYTSPNFSTLVLPGFYTVRVTKDGYPEFQTSVSIGSSPVTLVANFGNSGPPTVPPPQLITKYQLTVSSDRPGAEVYIDGSYAGRTPLRLSMKGGNYRITLRLPGYAEFEQRIHLENSYSLYAAMQPLEYNVFIDAPGVQGVLLYRNSTLLGSLPYSGSWPRGDYVVRLSAPGYADYIENVRINAPWNARISLTALYVDYEIKLPAGFMPKDFEASKDYKGKSWKDLELYLDGQRLESPYGRATVGTHLLTLQTGIFKFETQFEIKPGKSVVIEPFFGARVY